MITLSPSLHLSLSPLLAAFNVDGWILAFSAVTVIATIWMGFRSAKKSRTASDFFVAGRSVGVGMNASAISGEYLSAASFMGIAGMVMSSGYDALWYPVCYACGYLFLLLFIAGPLRRFGAYTIPDFAEGRFDSPVFRKIAVVFVLFIGFFYTMPQMKGAGVTLAYIFPGLPYWAGVVLVGAVITLNVALGGMKGITLVQAFQYWIKMFAISVPIFVLMAVYGHYGKQVGANGGNFEPRTLNSELGTNAAAPFKVQGSEFKVQSFEFQTFSSALRESMTLQERLGRARAKARGMFQQQPQATNLPVAGLIRLQSYDGDRTIEVYEGLTGRTLLKANIPYRFAKISYTNGAGLTHAQAAQELEAAFAKEDWHFLHVDEYTTIVAPRSRTNEIWQYVSTLGLSQREPLPPKAPADATWLNPFGPLTTKAAKITAAAIGKKAAVKGSGGEGVQGSIPLSPSLSVTLSQIPLRPGLSPEQRMTVNLDSPTVAQALGVYAELTGRQLLPNTNSIPERVDDLLGGKLSQLKLIARTPVPDTGVREHGDGAFTAAEVKAAIEAQLRSNGLALVAVGEKGFRVEKGREGERVKGREGGASSVSPAPFPTGSLSPGAAAEQAWLAKHEKPLALLYTYSLIIAIVCGTAGLPHILVRFYTNPDGTAAKKTTMWVMVLIGVFYLFPPVFGVMGRNLLPSLYSGTGAKGTDKVVLELPKVVERGGKGEMEKGSETPVSLSPTPPGTPAVPAATNARKGLPWGSILSGITCAGAFAAFMSTFSGLLVSMTGALAHDVYGRILRPKSTPEQRMRMFKWCAVLIGAIAVVLGSFVEPLEINFMVGQAFGIAAASYFPLLFMSVWWRGMTMLGAATGMLTGGLSALAAVTVTNISNLALDKGPMGKIFSGFAPLNDFWAAHPLARILCEQPAIWTVPLAILLMVVVSKLTTRAVPADIRQKMLVLHAPEQLGLKQEYIQEHQAH